MEEWLPLYHNHLWPISLMSQSQTISCVDDTTLDTKYQWQWTAQHKANCITDKCLLPWGRIKDANMDFSKANITMNALFSDIRDSYSIVCDTTYLKMFLSVQDLMVTFWMDGRRRKVKTDHEALHWKVSCILCAQEICSYSLWRTEWRVTSRTSNFIGSQGHRENIPRKQKCGGGAGGGMYFC